MADCRVLIVDEHPDGRESLRKLLELWSCEVEVARDGLEGLKKALVWKPDVAILDVDCRTWTVIGSHGPCEGILERAFYWSP